MTTLPRRNIKSGNDQLRAELSGLVQQGTRLLFAMAVEFGLDTSSIEHLPGEEVDLPNVYLSYDAWYSVALRVVRQILPDRLDDFVTLYRHPGRKAITYETYTISDYLMNLEVSRPGATTVSRSAALPKLQAQRSILASAQSVLDSALADIGQVLAADLFDSELDAACALSRQGFVRAGGAIAGVVLEKHLAHICSSHALKTEKRNPGISEYNDKLKESGTIDLVAWRFIQVLGDLRNLCDHPKDREPTQADVAELVEGVRKITRTVY